MKTNQHSTQWSIVLHSFGWMSCWVLPDTLGKYSRNRGSLGGWNALRASHTTLGCAYLKSLSSRARHWQGRTILKPWLDYPFIGNWKTKWKLFGPGVNFQNLALGVRMPVMSPASCSLLSSNAGCGSVKGFCFNESDVIMVTLLLSWESLDAICPVLSPTPLTPDPQATKAVKEKLWDIGKARVSALLPLMVWIQQDSQKT